MKLLIGKKIKRLRQEKGLTQEELAAHLGVSFQTVSKWERGDGYPELTTLPALAQYFHITVDELIGMEEWLNEDEYREINRTWAKNNKAGLHKENVELMRKSLKAFPNNENFLIQLSASLEKMPGSEEEREKHLKESIAAQEQILRYSEDSETRGATLFNICFSYMKNGETEKALEQANKLPSLLKGKENALVYFLQGEERHAVAKEAMRPLAWSVTHHLCVLAEEENDPKYLEKAEKMLDLFFEGEEDSFIRSLRVKIKKK